LENTQIFPRKSQKKREISIKILECLAKHGPSKQRTIVESLGINKQSISRDVQDLYHKGCVDFVKPKHVFERKFVKITLKGFLLFVYSTNEKSLKIKYFFSNFNSIFNAQFDEKQLDWLESSINNREFIKCLRIISEIFFELSEDPNIKKEIDELLNIDFEDKDLNKLITEQENSKNKSSNSDKNSSVQNLMMKLITDERILRIRLDRIINWKKMENGIVDILSKKDALIIKNFLFDKFLIPLFNDLTEGFDEWAEICDKKANEYQKMGKKLEQKIKLLK